MTWEGLPSSRIQTNLYRRLYGYRTCGKRYPGLVETHRATKLHSGCLLVSLEAAREFRGLFQDLEISVRVQNVSAY